MTAAEPPCGFRVEDYRRTYEAHGRDEHGYCLGFHWDRGVAWPCDVRIWAEVALDVAERSRQQAAG
jgi:hypothetical protein